MSSIGIIDYGMGNLRSVQKALEKLGFAAYISSDAATLSQADKLILPGVGAFRDAIARLRETRLDETIRAHVAADKPLLGICLGMQLLFTRGHEDGFWPGLDILPGEVVRFAHQPGLKVPHMGWNHLTFPRECALFAGLPEQPAVYFVHSYYVVPGDTGIVTAEVSYPTPVTAAIQRGNVYATQFHPEKSQALGLRILRNFAELA